MVKRCHIGGVTRDKEYNITRGVSQSQLLYMSVNPNGEAEVLKVYHKPRPRLRKAITDLNFADIIIKGKQSQGNILTRFPIQKVALKEAGVSTLAGISVWYDREVKKLNNEGRGELLGEFKGKDRTIIFTKKGQYYTAGFNTSLYFPEDIMLIEKFNPNKVFTAVLYDASQKYFYLKRFRLEDNDKLQYFIDESARSYLVALNDDDFPRVEITYTGAHKNRPADIIDAESFIGVKSHNARGKRLTTYTVENISFIEPERFKEEEEEEEIVADENFDMEDIDDIIPTIEGDTVEQPRMSSLFGDEEEE